MFTLPDVPGRFAVGAATFAGSLDDPCIIGASRTKAGNDTGHEPALFLEETVFTVYYPANLDVGSETAGLSNPVPRWCKGMNWLIRPVKESLLGYARFGALPFWVVQSFLGPYATRLKIPVYQNAPLLDPTIAYNDPEAQWPLVLFSHGLCGTRTTYSQMCSRLAAEGKVVLALEHRDGTTPSSMPSTYSHHDMKGRKDRPQAKHYIIPEKDVIWEGGEEPEPFAFRIEQLIFRRFEMYLAYTLFADIVAARPAADSPILGPAYTIDGPQLDSPAYVLFWKSWVSSPPRVQCARDVTLVGHSFGGATVLSILSNPPPVLPPISSSPSSIPHFTIIPVRHAIVLDPWLQPLPSPGPIPHAGGAALPRLLVINSEEFTMWKEHFARLQDVVHNWRHDACGGEAAGAGEGKEEGPGLTSGVVLATLVRAKHVSFSDFAALGSPGRSAKGGRRLLDAVGALALAFMGDRMQNSLQDAKLVRRKMQVEWVGQYRSVSSGVGRSTGNRRLIGEVGDVIIH